MKSGKLLDAIGMVGDDLIDEARAPQKKVIQWKHWTSIAACLALVIAVVMIVNPFQMKETQATDPIEQKPPIALPIIHNTELQASASPDKAYIGHKPANPSKLCVDYAYYFIYIEARAVEILPDTYIEYAGWNSAEIRIARMQTIFSHEEMNVPEEFYLALDPKFMVDFLQYDCLVLPYLYQYGVENTALYNVVKKSPEAFDLILFGTPGFRGGVTIYAFTDGTFDESLWTINEVWADDTEYYREQGTEFETLEEIRTYFCEDYGYGSSRVVQKSDIAFEQGIAALEYVKPFDNGVFVQFDEYGVNDSFSFNRFINGIPTNEYIHFSLHNETVSYSGTAFTQDDMDSLPDVASAIATIEDAFQNGQIIPPHIVNYKDMELRSHGVTGWYFKANDKVYGVVQLNFTYYDADEKESRYDDIYFLIEPGSETCVEISRDELLQLQGTNHFIYTHEYDENGKVPGNYAF